MKQILIVFSALASTALAKEYYVSQVELTFVQAYATCTRYGYNLATEDTPEATANINKAIIAAGSNEKDHFIGGFQQKSSDFMPKWIWFETGEYVGYTNWENGECSLNECLIKRGAPSTDEYTGVWISSACTNQHRFVCEAEL